MTRSWIQSHGGGGRTTNKEFYLKTHGAVRFAHRESTMSYAIVIAGALLFIRMGHDKTLKRVNIHHKQFDFIFTTGYIVPRVRSGTVSG